MSERTNKYEDIEIQVGTYEGFPVTEVIKAEDQKDWVESGGSIKELVNITYTGYRDWQADC